MVAVESIPPEDTTVQRSSCEESLPDTWEIPGGTAELHEPNLGASAAREIYVETDPVTGEIKLRSDGKALKWRKYSFLAEVEGGKDSGPPNVLLDPEEHQAYAWATAEEVLGDKAGEVKLTWTSATQKPEVVRSFEVAKTMAARNSYS